MVFPCGFVGVSEVFSRPRPFSDAQEAISWPRFVIGSRWFASFVSGLRYRVCPKSTSYANYYHEYLLGAYNRGQ